ncbi:MAG: glycosyltransferase, partial [Candidatus Binatia bacterium]
MRISIIVPVLNEERAIAAALESLTLLAIEEVIVVDGGSTDHTREIVAGTQAVLASSP